MSRAFSEGPLSAINVRAVTTEEIDLFFENGWVKVSGLIDRDTAAMLLNRAKRAFGEDGRTGLQPLPEDAGYYQSWFRSNTDLEKDEAFEELAASQELGHNSARLLGRDSSIRMMIHKFSAKLPDCGDRGKPTDFHQDTPGHMYLEGNFLTIWIALDEITPDMGALQYYTGSHKLGNLGRSGDLFEQWGPLIDRYCTLTDPIGMQAGDAVIHMDRTIHGTEENTSGRVRWSWAGVLVPGDARYTGASNYFVDGLGLEPDGPLDHPKFPIIYAPPGWKTLV